MKVIDPGHVYDLDWFDGDPPIKTRSGYQVWNELVFMKREGDKYPGNVGHHPGTNIQEVLRALIDRVKYLDKQIPHDENTKIIMNLRSALWSLECRAAERHGRKKPRYIDIELEPTCTICGHVGCEGTCHSKS